MNDSSSLTCPFPIEAKSLELIDLYNYHLLVSVENVLLFLQQTFSCLQRYVEINVSVAV